jgi:hypothetical protein
VTTQVVVRNHTRPLLVAEGGLSAFPSLSWASRIHWFAERDPNRGGGVETVVVGTPEAPWQGQPHRTVWASGGLGFVGREQMLAGRRASHRPTMHDRAGRRARHPGRHAGPA